jgi:hypothetical protein
MPQCLCFIQNTLLALSLATSGHWIRGTVPVLKLGTNVPLSSIHHSKSSEMIFFHRNFAAEQLGYEAAVQHTCYVAGGGVQGSPEPQGQVC